MSRKGIPNGPVCPYCHKPAILTTGVAVYPNQPHLAHKWFWTCIGCDARVGCHPPARPNGKGGVGDGKVPLGSLADSELRRRRNDIHSRFDHLWQMKGGFTRKDAYAWMSEKMNVHQFHVAELDIDGCKRASEILFKELGL